MLMIRLQRIGRKHEPAFRLVLTDSKNSTKSGKFLEILGNYDARRGEKSEFKADRITYWIGTGAQLSDTVHNLLVDKKVITGKKINKLPKKSATKPEPVVEVTSAPTAEATEPESVVEETPESEPVVDETPVAEPVVENVPAEEVTETAPAVEETPVEVTESVPAEEVVA